MGKALRSQLARLFVESQLFDEEPFSLIDVGCLGGIAAHWDCFGDSLIAHGFDPKLSEVEKMNAEERRQGVEYHAAWIGLDRNHPFMRRKAKNEAKTSKYFADQGAQARSSASWVSANEPESYYFTYHFPDEELTDFRISVDEFVQRHDIAHVDFIKTDTDGHDLQALISCESVIRNAGVLGLCVEAPLVGGLYETSEAYHAIDLFLQQNGFLPYELRFYNYTRAELPGVFSMDNPAQTQKGPTNWGDVVYLRDMASPHYTDIWPKPTLIQGLKMLCLYEMYDLNDCAVELLLKRRELFEPAISVNAALDMLTPDLNGKRLKYKEYTSLFKKDYKQFYPSKQKAPIRLPLDAAMTPSRDRSLMIWGTKGAYEDHYRQPLLNGEYPEFLGFIDGDPGMHGQKVDGYPVYAPWDLATLRPDSIAIASWAVNEIAEQISAIMMPELVFYERGLMVLDLLPGTDALAFANDVTVGMSPEAGRLFSTPLDCRDDFNRLTVEEVSKLEFVAGHSASGVVRDFNCTMTRLIMLGDPMQRLLNLFQDWRRFDESVWAPEKLREFLKSKPSLEALAERCSDKRQMKDVLLSPWMNRSRLSAVFIAELMEESLFLFSKRFRSLDLATLSPKRAPLQEELTLDDYSQTSRKAMETLLAPDFHAYDRHRQAFEEQIQSILDDPTYIAFKAASTAANAKFREAYLRGDFRYLPAALHDRNHPSGFHEQLNALFDGA